MLQTEERITTLLDAEGIFNTVKYDIPPLLETAKFMKTNR